MTIVFLNGNFMPEEEACIPISDRGFLFGDGIFATLRVFNGVIENVPLHLNRLTGDAHQLHITPPMINEEWLREIVLRNNALTGSWRMKIILTGGASEHLSLSPRSTGVILITLKPSPEPSNNSLRLTIFPEAMHHPAAHIKSTSYLDRLIIRDYARQREFDDTLVATADKHLLETSFSNIFWCVGNKFFTPDPKLPLLYGVTIQVVEQVARKLGMEIHYVRTTLEEIDELAQFFVCNALHGIRPVYVVGDCFFETDAAVSKKLKNAYEKRINDYSLDCRKEAKQLNKPESAC